MPGTVHSRPGWRAAPLPVQCSLQPQQPVSVTCSPPSVARLLLRPAVDTVRRPALTSDLRETRRPRCPARHRPRCGRAAPGRGPFSAWSSRFWPAAASDTWSLKLQLLKLPSSLLLAAKRDTSLPRPNTAVPLPFVFVSPTEAVAF